MFRGGDVVAANCFVRSFERCEVRAGWKAGDVPDGRVGELVFTPVPPEQATPSGKPGVLLSSGDFVDGEITALRLSLWAGLNIRC